VEDQGVAVLVALVERVERDHQVLEKEKEVAKERYHKLLVNF
jgi:hypothetical protein